MRQFISLCFILCLNSLTFASVIVLTIAKWGVIDKQTGLLVLLMCFLLGLWNVLTMVELVTYRQKDH